MGDGPGLSVPKVIMKEKDQGKFPRSRPWPRSSRVEMKELRESDLQEM